VEIKPVSSAMSSQENLPPNSISLKWGRFQLIVTGRLALGVAVVVVAIGAVVGTWLKVLH
jgi:hypothetical protein